MTQDLTYTLRTYRKSPAFTLTAVAALALGIGANTAIFSIVRAVLWNPLAFRDPDRLVYLSISDPQRHVPDGQFTKLRLDELRSAAHTLDGIAAYGANVESTTVSGTFEPEALRGARVSANFLDVLGVRPMLGRSFLPQEDTAGAPPAVMISAALWRRRFGSDPRVAGKTIVLDATPYAIAGVLPEGFQFPFANVAVWFPKPSQWSVLPSRYWGASLLKGIARLGPGITLEQARSEMSVLSAQYSAAHPGLDHGSLQVLWLRDRLVRNVRPLLNVLFGAVGFVLLIACANVAALLMARATSRSREFALRAALGAARARLVRQLLIESVLLALAGGALGILVARWCLAVLKGLEFAGGSGGLYLPGRGDAHLDGMVLAFTFALSVATGVLFGLFPSLRFSRPDLAGVLRESGSGAGRSWGGNPRAILVVIQVALSVVLLIGAALLLRSFARLRDVDPGFQAADLLTLKIALSTTRYDTAAKRASFFDDLLQRLDHTPGVTGATIATTLPTTTWIRTNLTRVQGQPAPDERDPASYAVILAIAPGYFRALQIPLRRGREFETRDNVSGAPPTIIINESLARRIWKDYPRGIDPVGQHIAEAYDKNLGMFEVIGIAADIHEGGLASEATPEFYVPYALHPPQSAYVALRAHAGIVGSVRQAVAAVDPDQAISEVRTMQAVLDGSLGNRRWMLGLLGAFAAAALLLAMIGLYGAIADSVSQRVQEMGIRRALGAQEREVVGLLLFQSLRLALLGIVLGIAGARAMSGILKSLLFEISPTDAGTYVAIAVLFLLVAAVASYLPARRAARIDPMAALRVG